MLARLHKYRLLFAAVAAAAVTGIAIGAMRPKSRPPKSNSGSERIEGDTRLATLVLDMLPSTNGHAVGIASVNSDGVRVATIGTPLTSTFEIGSINKGITGMLYVDCLKRGEVHPSTTLGELFDLAGCKASGITLEELSQHRSGLPAQPMGIIDVARIMTRMIQAKNPFDGRTVNDLLHDLRRVSVGAKEPTYSNLGFAALGHALAVAAGTDYPTLLRNRITEPLGLEGFYVPVGGEAGLDEHAIEGRDSEGRVQQAWTDLQYAPAGGVRTDVMSMANLAQALLAGTAPGAAALDPTADFSANGADRVGAGWITSQVKDRNLTWHNGSTGGFSSWIGLDRKNGNALFLVAATTLALDEFGETLLLNS